MDASEDDNGVKLQRASKDLVTDFKNSLRCFLWQTTKDGKQRIRRRVRVRETDRLVALLEHFQELPQLLDPHLADCVSLLAEILLDCIQTNEVFRVVTDTKLLLPLPAAICRLLYTFCKVRGEKVIVRFFSTEIRHVELLLAAIEAGRSPAPSDKALNSWTWEERYIVLLWLSQLLLAPFDLALISSDSTENSDVPIPGLIWPSLVPDVGKRLICLSMQHISSSGKEQDAAKTLLVRVAVRKDMQQLGVSRSLIRWALSSLQPHDVEHPIHHYIGVLSFIAGLLISSATTDITDSLAEIYEVTQDISGSESPLSQFIKASVVSRKLMIKIFRNIATSYIQISSAISAEIIEDIIGNLLESLADAATPVRLAASKALSMVSLKLAPAMALQIVEAVLELLKQNVVQSTTNVEQHDLSRVKPLEWHGLILTLSHLLYRRCPPADSISHIIPALLTGLVFEQTSATGTSLGTNVRDAACFGIWALARRYTTAELAAVPFESGDGSVLQVLATHLITTASLDPAGNIRRGASAALQELIGRHPNTIIEGIAAVQVVDYHAVALRSRAIQEVALNAAKLSSVYRHALFQGMLGWRGVGDPDASARRNLARALRSIVSLMPRDWSHLFDAFNPIQRKLDSLKVRQINERHGLLLCHAAIIESIHHALSKGYLKAEIAKPTGLKRLFSKAYVLVNSAFEDAVESAYRRPELLAEAVCRLLIATYPIMVAGVAMWHLERCRDDDGGNIFDTDFSGLLSAITRPDATPWRPTELETISPLCRGWYGASALDVSIERHSEKLLGNWLHLNEPEVVQAASALSAKLLQLAPEHNRYDIMRKWVDIVSAPTRGSAPSGFLHAILAGFSFVPDLQVKVCAAIHKRWHMGHHIETRAIILQCVAGSSALISHIDAFVELVAEGLDDYTTNARGDVGSLVRIEAIKAAATLWGDTQGLEDHWKHICRSLFGKILRLAGEKLDKVRAEAQNALVLAMNANASAAAAFKASTPSSHQYFLLLLEIREHDYLVTGPYQEEWSTDLLEGYVTSCDTGSEDLVQNSRAALADYCDAGNHEMVCKALIAVLKRNLTNDRVLVPVLEVLSFLFDVRILQQCVSLKYKPAFLNIPSTDSPSYRTLYALIQRSHYKTTSIRKLDAAIKLYAGLSEVYPDALEKLTSMLLHTFPKVRDLAADALFGVRGVGKGVNWRQAGKEEVQTLRAGIRHGEGLAIEQPDIC